MKEPDFDWRKYTDAFNKVLDDAEKTTGIEAIVDNKVFSLRNTAIFLDNILSGKINRHNAEKEYIEKIKSDEDLLRNSKSFAKNKNAQELASIMNDVKEANTISLSRHEQVCLMRLRFERYFSHH